MYPEDRSFSGRLVGHEHPDCAEDYVGHPHGDTPMEVVSIRKLFTSYEEEIVEKHKTKTKDNGGEEASLSGHDT